MNENVTTAAEVLEPFVDQWTALLTTYRRDGTPIGTPLNIAVEGERAFIRTFDTAWKLKRIRHSPEVEIAPSTVTGQPTGPAIHAHARILSGDESKYASQTIARKYPIFQGFLIPLLHRLRGNKTIHLELTPLVSQVKTRNPVRRQPGPPDNNDAEQA